MRTQWLQVVPAIDPEAECDFGNAANDGPAEAGFVGAGPVAVLASATDVFPTRSGECRGLAVANDDYWLGGYAGI